MPSLAVFLDLDGTLVQYDRPYEAITAATLEAHLGESSPALVELYSEAFFDAFEALAPHPYRRGMKAVLDATGASADPQTMVDTLREKEHAILTVDPAVPDALETLGANGPLGVLTNGVHDWQRDKLNHVGLSDYIDAVVASYDAGAHKPAPAPFHRAEATLPANEYLMIGDNDNDIGGARATGWRSLRHTRARPFWTRLPTTD